MTPRASLATLGILGRAVKRHARWMLLVGCLLAITGTPSWGLNIIWETLATTTHPGIDPGDFAAENPANDPTGARLLNILEHVEDRYEDIFEDNATIRITWWWDQQISSGLIGQSIPALVREDAMGNITHATIRFNPNTNWYIDDTPENDSEYTLTQRLYDFGPRALNAAEKANRFAGNVPDLYEAGFNGPAVPGNPMTDTEWDLLSVAFHETLHSLGMNAGFPGLVTETNDGDFDVDPDFVRGAFMDLLPRGTGNDPNDHLAGNDAVVSAIQSGVRTRPSAADVMATAAAQNWTNIDLSRQDFLGGTNWNNAGNWMGNQTPGAFDIAFVRHGGTVTLNANDTVDTLLIDNSSTVFTGANRLSAVDAIAVQQTSGPGASFLSIPAGGEAAADLLFVNSNGRVIMTGGLVDANDMVIALAGLVSGNGTIDISDALGSLIIDGTIAANGGTLIVDSSNNLGIDFDGILENGNLQATGGDLIFNTGSPEPFNGTATVAAGREMAFNSGVGIGAGGLLELDGQANSAAEVSGLVAVHTNGVIRGDGRAIIGTLQLGDGGIVETNDAAAEIRLNGTTFYQGGTLLGTGRVHQTGNAVVEQDTTISVSTYDMDGISGTSTITVQPNRTLDINSSQVEFSANDGYDGTMNINGGVVDIAAAWNVEGTVNINESGGSAGELTGVGGVTLDSGAQLNVSGAADITTSVAANPGSNMFIDGDAEFSGPTTLGNGAMIEVNDPTDSVRFRGDTLLVAPNFVGGGRLILEDNVNVALLDTSIGLAEVDLDGTTGNTSITINDGITFSISSNTIEPTSNDGFDGTILNRGTFSVLAGWRLDGTLNMDPITGNTATLSGFGPFEIHTTGEMNTFDNVIVNPDTMVNGTINVESGRTQINGTTTISSSATVMVDDGAELELNGPIDIGGGSFSGGGTLQFDGTTNVNAITTMNVAYVDLDGTSGTTETTLNNVALTLNAAGIDQAGAANRFDGVMNINGTLAQLAVNLDDPMAAWQMNGTLNVSGGFLIAQTALNGSPVLVTGTINADSVANASANIDLSGTLTTADAGTNFRFAGGGDHIIRSTATVSGPGRISATSGSTLTLENGVALGVHLDNSGRLQLGTSPGLVSVSDDFQQFASGELEIELGGELLSEHDQLSVTGTADLAGTLDLSLIDGFNPMPYDVISVVTATGGVQEMFDSVEGVVYAADFGLAVTYGPNSVDVQAALLGDANLDGSVDADDFDIWNTNKFTDGNSWTSADFDGNGLVNGHDFLLWNANKGMSLDAAVSIPEPTHSVVLCAVVLAFLMRSIGRVPRPNNARLA